MPGGVHWQLAQPDQAAVDKLARTLSLSPPAAACLVNRGYTDPEQASSFLDPRLSELALPEGMIDLERAARRTADAVARKERIGVFGDYDVDGVSSAALVVIALRDLGMQVEVGIGDRFSGYGMKSQAMERFASARCSLIIALDTGTSDHKAAARAKELGIDLVVVDHHRTDGPFPDVLAFVNPHRPDCGFADKNLAAVGLAFYFTAALRSALVADGRIARSEMDMRSLLDLVALGTVADVMPLLGNNRIFVRHGLRQISRSPRPGLKALLRMANVRAPLLRAEHVAFQLAPRLNAAGRMSTAKDALELLLATSGGEAERLAELLDRLSKTRKTLEDEVLRLAEKQIAEQGLADDPVLVTWGDSWHWGVLGIVAARLNERYSRPAYVIGLDGDTGVGSARGKGQIDLHQSLAAAASRLKAFGGHRDAAGFTVTRDEVPALAQALREQAKESWTELPAIKTLCDARLSASQINTALLNDLEKIGPFGPGNPQPVFEVDGLYVLERRVVGRDHLRLELKTPTGSIPAFGPKMGGLASALPPLICVAAAVTPNDWRGDRSPQLKLVVPPIPSG